jgi:hypothetical protein
MSAAFRAAPAAPAALALLEELEVVLRDEDGLSLSVASQLDASARG